MLAIGCDHGGFDLMQEIIAYLDEKGIAYKNFGITECKSVDYPDIALPVAEERCQGGMR